MIITSTLLPDKELIIADSIDGHDTKMADTKSFLYIGKNLKKQANVFRFLAVVFSQLTLLQRKPIYRTNFMPAIIALILLLLICLSTGKKLLILLIG